MFEREYYFQSEDHAKMFLLTKVRGKYRDMDLSITNHLFADRIAASKWYDKMMEWLTNCKQKFSFEEYLVAHKEIHRLYHSMTGGE